MPTDASHAREILIHLVDRYLADADDEDTDLATLSRHGGTDLVDDFKEWLDANEGG